MGQDIIKFTAWKDTGPACIEPMFIDLWAEFVELSPMYPVGGIPVPGLSNMTSNSVEGIWQGLKILIDGGGRITDADTTYFATCSGPRKGTVLGHDWGLQGLLLPYADAHRMIYLPAYAYQLTKQAVKVAELRERANEAPLIFLDASTPGTRGAAQLLKYWIMHDGTFEGLDRRPSSQTSCAPPHIF